MVDVFIGRGGVGRIEIGKQNLWEKGREEM